MSCHMQASEVIDFRRSFHRGIAFTSTISSLGFLAHCKTCQHFQIYRLELLLGFQQCRWDDGSPLWSLQRGRLEVQMPDMRAEIVCLFILTISTTAMLICSQLLNRLLQASQSRS